MSDSPEHWTRACAQLHEKPPNPIRAPQSSSLLDRYYHRLDQEKRCLFDGVNDKSHVAVWEGWAGDHCLRNSQWNDIEDVKAHIDNHLLRREKDLQVCCVFIPIGSSSAPIGCTLEMFLSLCTYHQVSPEFLDLVCSIGRDDSSSREFHRNHISQQTDNKDSQRLEIIAHERSSYEKRVSYQVCTMELSDDNKGWKLREMAVYHSLNVATGSSFCLTTTANDMLTKRVVDTLSDAQGDAHIILHSPQDSLAKALQTHLAIIDWQQKSWRSYMCCLEQDLRSKLDHLDDLMQHLTDHNEADINCQEQFEHKIRRLSTLRANSWKELQQLNLLSSNLKKAKVTVTRNNVTLKELNEYYSSLLEAPSLPEAIRTDCAKNMREFTTRMGALERSTESECLRCDMLMHQLEDGKAMYALMLEEQSKETERQFALNSTDSTERMEQETSSMHIITIITLIFLLGTFIAAVFSTPIFSDGSPTTFDKKMFVTFLAICIPLTVITTVAWMVYMRYRKSRRNRTGTQRARRNSEV